MINLNLKLNFLTATQAPLNVILPPVVFSIVCVIDSVVICVQVFLRLSLLRDCFAYLTQFEYRCKSYCLGSFSPILLQFAAGKDVYFSQNSLLKIKFFETTVFPCTSMRMSNSFSQQKNNPL